MTEGWTKQRDRIVRPVLTGDYKKWWLLSLYLYANRHCPEAFSDDEVSIALGQLWDDVQPLPFGE